jgi:hypothetical protein
VSPAETAETARPIVLNAFGKELPSRESSPLLPSTHQVTPVVEGGTAGIAGVQNGQGYEDATALAPGETPHRLTSGNVRVSEAPRAGRPCVPSGLRASMARQGVVTSREV